MEPKPEPTRIEQAVVPPPLATTPDEILARCRGPRYWPARLLVLWLRLMAILPWRFVLSLHKGIGRLAGLLSRRRRHIVGRNLEICFPHLSQVERDALVGKHFANVGAFFAELALAWFEEPERHAHLFTCEGVEHLQEALARGKGVVLYTGHFTTLEICGATVRPLVPLYAFMFSQRGNPVLDAAQRRGRARYAHLSVPANNVRDMLGLLARNAVVWYAPDQVRTGTGKLVPFFGEPAMTSTAPSRLARISGAAIVPMFFRRKDDDSGYLVRFHAPLQDFPSGDLAQDTARLTTVLEGFIRECPEQYFWIHRKFKGRPQAADAYEAN
jgi:KDO2-lipid IV(A) lauroyltransferase